MHLKPRASFTKGRAEALCAAQAWTQEPAALCAGQFPVDRNGGLKRGEGTHPCFVCGEANHRWIECKRRKPTRCPVCGFATHRALQYTQRYVPQTWKEHPPAPARNLAIPPTNFCAGGCVSADDPQLSQSNGVLANAVARSMEEDGVPSLPQPPPEKGDGSENTPPTLIFAQAAITTPNLDLCSVQDAKWFRECWKERTQTKSRLDGIKPLHDPALMAKLLYRVSVDSVEAAALMDYGAMLSFINKRFTERHSLPTHSLAPPVQLRLLKGQSTHQVRERYVALRLTVAAHCSPWEFLVLGGLPHEVVLGMDFVKKMHVMYDPYSDLIFVGGPSRVPPTLPAANSLGHDANELVPQGATEIQATFLDLGPSHQLPYTPVVGTYSVQAYEEGTSS